MLFYLGFIFFFFHSSFIFLFTGLVGFQKIIIFSMLIILLRINGKIRDFSGGNWNAAFKDKSGSHNFVVEEWENSFSNLLYNIRFLCTLWFLPAV
jgi:hypothetical protein